MADGWIELFDVETDEAELLFVFDRFEPVDYGCGVFPLVEVVFFRNCAVDAVDDVFADFAYLGLLKQTDLQTHQPHEVQSALVQTALKS